MHIGFLIRIIRQIFQRDSSSRHVLNSCLVFSKVFQRRENDIVDFYRTWSEYETGFGLVVVEHWLGNEKIHRLTSQKRYTLRVDLWDWTGNTAYAEYDLFIVLGEDTRYQLSVGGYRGNSGKQGVKLTILCI